MVGKSVGKIENEWYLYAAIAISGSILWMVFLATKPGTVENGLGIGLVGSISFYTGKSQNWKRLSTQFHKTCVAISLATLLTWLSILTINKLRSQDN